jgi:predicted Zn-dependent protease with MMP-like domain
MTFAVLHEWAEQELAAVMKVLPGEIQKAAAGCAVSLENKPGDGEWDQALEGDELGLFEGPSLMDDPAAEELPRIRLFLENLWEWVEQDEQDYRDEVGTTYLHELGHYLGWDEDEVAERGLE